MSNPDTFMPIESNNITMRRVIFYAALLGALVSLVLRLWPLDREILIAVVSAEAKVGLINHDGRVVIEPEWVKIRQFDQHGISVVSADGVDYQIMDRFGRVRPGNWGGNRTIRRAWNGTGGPQLGKDRMDRCGREIGNAADPRWSRR